MKICVKTGDGDLALDNVPGEFLSRILLDAGLGLNQRCGGDGSCGGCAIVLERGVFTVGARQLAVDAQASRQVQACKTRAIGDGCVIRVPPRSRQQAGASIDADFEPPPFALDAQVRRLCFTLPQASLTDHRSDQERMLAELVRLSGLERVQVALALTRELARIMAEGGRCMTATLAADDGHWSLVALREGAQREAVFGLAIDIGTTTVVGMLVDLGSGAVVQKAARYNQQLSIADDVAARISAAKSGPDIERLRKLVVVDTINPIIGSVCQAQGIGHGDICRVSIAGNTVMVHLLLGLPVTNIGRLPFNPVLRDVGSLTAAQLGLTTNRRAPVCVAPAIAGYLGGDVSAGIVATQLLSAPDCSLLVDIGTNCEIVLKRDQRLICCATPAGPAFEGAGLAQGCRAMDGAIEHIRIGADLQFALAVIGDGAPVGVCGSAAIDFIAEGHRCGLINAAGRLNIDLLKRHQRYAQVHPAGPAVHACVIVAGELGGEQGRILISEADIAEILQAKAAIFAGIQTLLSSCALAPGRIAQLVLAGGFARHIDIDNAIRIGMLPDLPRDRFRVSGNSALAGAYLALVDARAAPAMRALRGLAEVVELNLVSDFEANFVGALYLPEPPPGQS